MYKFTSIFIGCFLLWETVYGYGLPTSQHAQPYPYQFHSSGSNNQQNYVNLDGNSYPEAKATPFDYYNPYYGGDNFFRQDQVIPSKSQFGYPYQIFVVSNANSQRHPGHSAPVPHRNVNPFNLAASLLSNFEAFDDGLSSSAPFSHHGGSSSSENLDFPLTGFKQFFKQFGSHANPNSNTNTNTNLNSNLKPIFNQIPFENQYPNHNQNQNQNQYQHQMPNIAHSQIQIEIIPQPNSDSNSGSGSDSDELNMDGFIKYNIEQTEPEIKIKLVENSPDSPDSFLPVLDGQVQVISSPPSIPSSSVLSSTTTDDAEKTPSESTVPVNIQIKTQVPVETDEKIGSGSGSERKEEIPITNSPTSSNENVSVNEPQMEKENDDTSPESLTILAVENPEEHQDDTIHDDTVIISLPQDSSNMDSDSSSSSDESVKDFVKEQETKEIENMEQEKKKPEFFVTGSGSGSSSSEEKIPMTILLGGSDKDILAFKSGLSSSSTPKPTPTTVMTSEKSVSESGTGTATEMMIETELTTETPNSGRIQPSARDDMTMDSTQSPSQVMVDDEVSFTTTLATDLARDDATTNMMNDEEKVTTSASSLSDDSENIMTTTLSPPLTE